VISVYESCELFLPPSRLLKNSAHHPGLKGRGVQLRRNRHKINSWFKAAEVAFGQRNEVFSSLLAR